MLTPDEIDFLETSPLTSDIGQTEQDVILRRLERVQELPANVQTALQTVETATFLRQEIEQRRRLPRTVTRRVADVLRAVLTGERSPASLQHDLATSTRLTPPQAAEIASLLTSKFVTPNYFQIAKLYEERQRTSQAAPAAPASTPPRVIDLRNGTAPTRLSPSPPRVPADARATPPSPPPQTPQLQAPPPAFLPRPAASTTLAPAPGPSPSSPPLPPRPAPEPLPPPPSRGLAPGKPLDELTPPTRPEPSQPSPPVPPRPPGGAHGPLPPPPVRGA